MTTHSCPYFPCPICNLGKSEPIKLPYWFTPNETKHLTEKDVRKIVQEILKSEK